MKSQTIYFLVLSTACGGVADIAQSANTGRDGGFTDAPAPHDADAAPVYTRDGGVPDAVPDAVPRSDGSPACAAEGQPCGDNGDCCSGKCSDFCVSPPDACAEDAGGAP